MISICMWNKIIVALVICSVFFIFVENTLGAIYYVDVKNSIASDSNAGDIKHPFKTVQKGLKLVSPGDTLIVRAGNYDLSGFVGILHDVTLIGEGENSTIIENVKKIQIVGSLSVSKLQFKNCKQLFYINLSSNQSISAISIHDCIFKNVPYVIFTSNKTKGKISGINIENCKFLDVNEDEVCTVCLTFGQISDILIKNNKFYKLNSIKRGCSAIVIGSNSNRDTTKNITISRNIIDTITGPVGTKQDPREVHGILAYGTNIIVDGNKIRNLNSGQDHEALYLKASYSKIINNKIEECGSGAGGADISIKGGANSTGNVITYNYIFSSKRGGAILVNGEATITYNYIRKINGLNGIDVYAYGKSVIITENSVEAKHKGIYVHDAGAGNIQNNYVISHESRPIKSQKSNIAVKDNDVCFGNECGILPMPQMDTIPSPPTSLRIIETS